MSSNKVLVNLVRATIGIAMVTLIGCAQFEDSFGELRGPEISQSANSSSVQDLAKSCNPLPQLGECT